MKVLLTPIHICNTFIDYDDRTDSFFISLKEDVAVQEYADLQIEGEKVMEEVKKMNENPDYEGFTVQGFPDVEVGGEQVDRYFVIDPQGTWELGLMLQEAYSY